ncbi:hypothetical protein [Staphylococcus chromogenes]|uniref:hypothetical protein n=1 Tax=Staphylococcus chromogenes TaxID=46126 RepID=UPI000D1C08D3|nr:hypothetical protein [Staphylococcus chromogenes]PTF70251.1 hypothetical protein BUY01_05425 [Staphylococcus chromogenes]PTG83561.1 hypothetical protein BU665_05235 [Staphylococcus chromogenes]
MDDKILSYLDKVGEKISGVAEKGFDVYIHGVFVTSLIYSIIGVVLVILGIAGMHIALRLNNGEENNDFKEMFQIATFIISPMIIIVGFVFVIANIVGVFAPDYIALKQIVEGVIK